MNVVLLQPSYFGTIATYATWLQSEEVVFEVCDHFQKQTFRTRCYIYGANGKLLLNVPVSHTKGIKKTTEQVTISYDEDWKGLHLKSLQSAYRCSPYFEFYEDDLIEAVFSKSFETLGELHTACHEFVIDALQESKKERNSTEYFLEPSNQKDYRKLVDAKKKVSIEFPQYVQMFDDKYGFIENLSILDLLFMEGPNAVTYLENLDVKNVLT